MQNSKNFDCSFYDISGQKIEMGDVLRYETSQGDIVDRVVLGMKVEISSRFNLGDIFRKYLLVGVLTRKGFPLFKQPIYRTDNKLCLKTDKT